MRGEVASETYLDARGAELGRLERERDAFGRVTETRYRIGGALAADPGTSCAVMRFEYANFADPTLECCLATDGKPVTRRDTGWATRRISYSFGRVIGEEFLDATGRPVKPKGT